MIVDNSLTGGIFLTASQSMQGLRTEMRLTEQANREASQTEVGDDLGGKTLQQAPSADQPREQAAAGR